MLRTDGEQFYVAKYSFGELCDVEIYRPLSKGVFLIKNKVCPEYTTDLLYCVSPRFNGSAGNDLFFL